MPRLNMQDDEFTIEEGPRYLISSAYTGELDRDEDTECGILGTPGDEWVLHSWRFNPGGSRMIIVWEKAE